MKELSIKELNKLSKIELNELKQKLWTSRTIKDYIIKDVFYKYSDSFQSLDILLRIIKNIRLDFDDRPASYSITYNQKLVYDSDNFIFIPGKWERIIIDEYDNIKKENNIKQKNDLIYQLNVPDGWE